MKVICASCKESFEGKRSTARLCSATCRSRARRRPSSSSREPSDRDAALVAQVRRQLEDAGRLDTFEGQLAVQLARSMSKVDATGVAALSKELRAVMMTALEGVESADEQSAAPVVEDAVARARERRDQARAAATGST